MSHSISHSVSHSVSRSMSHSRQSSYVSGGQSSGSGSGSTSRMESRLESRLESRAEGTGSRLHKPLTIRPRGGPRHEMRSLEQAASVWNWTGEGRGPQAWGKLRKDPELWDMAGDTLVYFGHQRPEPSFRIKAAILEETESSYFLAMLRDGSRHQNDRPPEYSYSAQKPLTPPASNRSTSPTTAARDVGSRASSFESEAVPAPPRPRLPRVINSLQKRGGQPTPPLSDRAGSAESPILYELYFPAPAEATKMDILRHHLTTRNVLALLLNKSLVGLNFYQALVDLHERLVSYMEPDVDSASLVIDYLATNYLDDVRNDPGAAAGLLAWSEEPSVRWDEGWREAFVHCVGMYPHLVDRPEFRDVSLVSRSLLENSHLELQIRVQKAEEVLATFNFQQIWPTQSAQPPPARSSFDRFQKFLKQFYESTYKTWPVKGARENGSGWLTRPLAMRLQRDFGALYDYFVDRDVVWNDEGRMVSKSKRATFRADTDDLPLTSFFTSFDQRHHFPRIPHAYPLLPTSIPVALSGKQSKSGALFSGLKKMRGDKETALAYAEASNVFLLGSDVPSNDLVEAFLKFEKRDQIGEINPVDARKGRWILLYCVLQALANLSVDTPELWHKDDVSYFLNPRLKGTPPWRGQTESVFEEASPELSHCWQVSQTWTNDHGLGWSGLRNHKQIVITMEGIGDGTGRGSSLSSDGRMAAKEKLDRARYWAQTAGPGTGTGTGTPGIGPGKRGLLDDSNENAPRPPPKNGPDAKDWPIHGPSPLNPKISEHRSDYVPPEDW
ncbi:MAG: hypothetical protein M1838_001203 [Thelocarpon superellum]|nr:MAG: hypothetical protein M1838_001203 [Thelocarpon superellum]